MTALAALHRLAAPRRAPRAVPGWLLASLGIHAALAWALLWLEPRPMAETAAREVALIWDESGQGAGDPRDQAVVMPPAPPESIAPAPPPDPPLVAMPPATPPDSLAPPPPPPVPPPPAAPLAAPPPPPPPQAAAVPTPPRPAPPNAAARPPASAPPRAAPQAAPLQAPAPGRPAAAPQAAGAAEAQGALVPARPLSGIANRPPDYPVESRLRGHAGTVTITARITPDGRVIEARVRETSGHPALDTAALEAIRRWRFEPALRDGVPVFATATLPVTFTLERARRW